MVEKDCSYSNHGSISMSWFDAAGFATLAKTALKEAQKTIDKALDIKNEETSLSRGKPSQETLPNDSDFFSAWGLGNMKGRGSKDGKSSQESSQATSPTESEAKSHSVTRKMSSNLWGSFAGSFFEPSEGEQEAAVETTEATEKKEPVSEQPKKTGDSFLASKSEKQELSSQTKSDRDVGALAVHENQQEQNQDESSVAFDRVVEVSLSDDNLSETVEVTGKMELQGTGVKAVKKKGGIIQQEWGWGWDSSIMMEAEGDTNLPPEEQFQERERSEESLCDDSLEADGFSKSKLVVGSVENETSSFGGHTSITRGSDFGKKATYGSVGSDDHSAREEDRISVVIIEHKVDNEKEERGRKEVESSASSASNSQQPSSEGNLNILKENSWQTFGEAELSSAVMDSTLCSPEDSSEKKSSESVEIVGSEGSTSPETDTLLASYDTSESFSTLEVKSDTKPYMKMLQVKPVLEVSRECDQSQSSPESVEVISESIKSASSVEVISESLTSPSSVEVISESSSKESSSFASPLDPDKTLIPKVAAALSAQLLETIHELKHGDRSDSTSMSDSIQVLEVENKVSIENYKTSEDKDKSAVENVELKSSEIVNRVLVETTEVIPDEEASFAESLHSSTSASSSQTVICPEINVFDSKAESDARSTTDSTITDSDLGDSTVGLHKLSVSLCSSNQESGEQVKETRTAEPVVSEEEETIDVQRHRVKSLSSNISSSYVKCMLEEAMVEGEESNRAVSGRDSSPTSSERSDLVKLESDQNSGHTSGDEVETTTTSSDIEIISSPNGEQSGPSRSSPVKLLLRATRGSHGLLSERSDSPSSDGSFPTRGKDDNMKKDKVHSHSSDSDVLLTTSTSSSDLPILIPGHQRKPSEASSAGSDENQSSEVDLLMKKLAGMAEILEAREAKLVELSRAQMELQEANSHLRSQVEEAHEKQAAESHDVTHIAEEYTQRLSTLEKKFQQAIVERDAFKKQTEHLKQEAASHVSSSEFVATLEEKDLEIKELWEEGEKLSKQLLQHSNIIKKLRLKEKETDATMKNQRDKLEEQMKEIDRLKKSKEAKEEVERKQIDAIRQLMSTTQKQDKETATLKNQLEEAEEKANSRKTALENAYKEIVELQRANAFKESETEKRALSAEMAAKQELRKALEESQQNAKLEQKGFINQIEDLRLSLSQQQNHSSRREEMLRKEISDIMQRFQASEARNEELSQAMTTATRPLLRQIENFQATYSTQQNSWEKVEKNLTDRLAESQAQLASAVDKERAATEQYIGLNTRVSSLESQLSNVKQENTRLATELQVEISKVQALEENKEKSTVVVEALKHSFAEEIAELKKEKDCLEHQLDMEKTAIDAERRKNTFLQEQLREKERQVTQLQATVDAHQGSPRSSPTPSLGRMSVTGSLSESFSSNPWPDEVFDPGLSRSNLYDSMRVASTASLLESLQSQLKQREGEIIQLQSEIVSYERVRESMAKELSRLTCQNEEIENTMKDLGEVQQQFKEMDQKYSTLLQMYGEKVEENEELKLDLQDVKEVYKSQIDQLLKK